MNGAWKGRGQDGQPDAPPAAYPRRRGHGPARPRQPERRHHHGTARHHHELSSGI